MTFTEGVHRLALRLSRDGRYLVASDRPDGQPLSTTTTDDRTHAAFDLFFDWGRGVCALRATANGRFVTVDDSGALVNRSELPNGWVVRETSRSRDPAVTS